MQYRIEFNWSRREEISADATARSINHAADNTLQHNAMF